MRAAALAVALALTAGCVNYPTVMEAGGTRVRPDKGRAVRQADGAAVYFELRSTGKYGDVITGVYSPVARQAALVDAGGAPVERVEVPGATTVSFTADGPHVVLSDLTRPLTPGETIIVTLLFEKSGGIGVITTVE
ncbi:MAG TPA: copper chaperone PCu(A)C [Methylomirabilota bacterium]|nr:copper chaperone PCu(A)C [Methylomirabilota bacterium]